MLNRRILGHLERNHMMPKRFYDWLGPVNRKDVRLAPSDGHLFFVSVCDSKGEAVSRFLQEFTEDQIATSARWSYLYARHVLGSRFPKGERIMQSRRVNPLWWRYYNEAFGMVDESSSVVTTP